MKTECKSARGSDWVENTRLGNPQLGNYRVGESQASGRILRDDITQTVRRLA